MCQCPGFCSEQDKIILSVSRCGLRGACDDAGPWVWRGNRLLNLRHLWCLLLAAAAPHGAKVLRGDVPATVQGLAEDGPRLARWAAHLVFALCVGHALHARHGRQAFGVRQEGQRKGFRVMLRGQTHLPIERKAA